MKTATHPSHRFPSFDVGPAAERLYGAVVHSSVFLGVATIGEVFVASTLAGVGPNVAIVVGLLATIGVYNLDKLADLDADAVNYSKRTAFVSAYPRLYAGASVAAVVGAVGLALWSGGVDALALTLFPGVVAAAYSFPVLPGDSVERLKDVFLVNTAAVSVAWAVPVAALPVAVVAADPSHLAGAAVAATWFFLRSAISVEVANVRDVAGDERAGVETLPTVVGVDHTRRILYAVDALSLVFVAAAAVVGAVPVWAPVALLPAFVFSVWITRAVTESTLSVERLCTLRDGEGFLMVVGVAAVHAGVALPL